MSETYPKSEGALFINKEKAHEKSPDWRGSVEVTKDQVMKLVEMGKRGIEPKLQLAAWDRTSKAGEDYKYIQAEAYIKPEKKEEPSGWDMPY